MKLPAINLIGKIAFGAILAPFVFWAIRVALDWTQRLQLLAFGFTVAIILALAVSAWTQRVKENAEDKRRDIVQFILISAILLGVIVAAIVCLGPGIPYR